MPTSILPSGVRIGIVDVPGHERFVKHMVAGAGGIDIVALIIAADEGVMPQTREHLDICTLLGITRGVVVLTKIDLVDQELREMAIADIKDFTKGTFLEKAPIIPVSAVTGEGLGDLITALEQLVGAGRAEIRRRSLPPPHRQGVHHEGFRHGRYRHPRSPAR